MKHKRTYQVNTQDKSTVYEKSVFNYPLDNVDTSWMTAPQKRVFEVLKNPENRMLHYEDITTLAGYKDHNTWYRCFSRGKSDNIEKFSQLLTNMGIKIHKQNPPYPSHHEVSYIKDPIQRNKYLDNYEWDMRMLFENFPRQCHPCDYIVVFSKIENNNIRGIIKRYYKNMLSAWKPRTFRWALGYMSIFFMTMHKIFPEINSLSELDREKHIEPILSSMTCSDNSKKESLNLIRSMFKFMYDCKWSGAPKSDSLIITYDIPKGNEDTPKPIPPLIKQHLDEYLENTILPLLENGKPTPFISPSEWDVIIIQRYTGRRFEDMAHLVADGSEEDCLKYDDDEDPYLFVSKRIAKIEKDLSIPLAHLNQYTEYGNIVERAIIRQRERVNHLDLVSDGYKYLFRKEVFDRRGSGLPRPIINSAGKQVVETLNVNAFNRILEIVCEGIPLKNYDGSIYKISTHQFRHTVATEMIDAGVDIYAVKEFLGHNSLAMTEKYIKLYNEKIKKEFEKKMVKSGATQVLAGLPEQDAYYDTKWVKNKIIAILELGGGCCEHPYKMPSCPHMACLYCIKRKAYPRHINEVKAIIESHTEHHNNFVKLGLSDKAKEADTIVKLHKVALEIISRGEVFVAAKHFYNKVV